MSSFGGVTFNDERDGDRLRRQLAAVRRIMLDGRWHTLAELSADVGAPQASVSARIRDLRKPKFGGYDVERAYVSRGLWKYRVVLPVTAAWAGADE